MQAPIELGTVAGGRDRTKIKFEICGMSVRVSVDIFSVDAKSLFGKPSILAFQIFVRNLSWSRICRKGCKVAPTTTGWMSQVEACPLHTKVAKIGQIRPNPTKSALLAPKSVR